MKDDLMIGSALALLISIINALNISIIIMVENGII